MDLDYLKTVDNLKKLPFSKCDYFLHDEHRWVLPIIYYAQEKGKLPKPCTLIMFDGHHDAKDPICIDEIRRVMKLGLSFEELLYLCREELSRLDDDWVKVGMELGLIGDAVIFGVRDRSDWQLFKRITDHQGTVHRIELLDLPGVELEYKGKLSDLANIKWRLKMQTLHHSLSELWAILDWSLERRTFRFSKNAKRIWLDIDLDCFVMNWKGYVFPWDDEVWGKNFLTASENSSTLGWTGKRFFNEFVNRAGLLTIAREPFICHGEREADNILLKMNHYLFDDNLQIELERR